MKEVPVIDIRQDRNEVAKMINEACIKWGFFLITGHGVQNKLIDHMFSVSYEFFDLSEDCLLYTSPSPRDRSLSRMPSSA